MAAADVTTSKTEHIGAKVEITHVKPEDLITTVYIDKMRTDTIRSDKGPYPKKHYITYSINGGELKEMEREKLIAVLVNLVLTYGTKTIQRTTSLNLPPQTFDSMSDFRDFIQEADIATNGEGYEPDMEAWEYSFQYVVAELFYMSSDYVWFD